MSKLFSTTLMTAAALAAMVSAAPMAAQAQSRSNGVTSCDAPGGRQRTGAVIGGILGAVVGSNLARNERTAGTIVGAGPAPPPPPPVPISAATSNGLAP